MDERYIEIEEDVKMILGVHSEAFINKKDISLPGALNIALTNNLVFDPCPKNNAGYYRFYKRVSVNDGRPHISAPDIKAEAKKAWDEAGKYRFDFSGGRTRIFPDRPKREICCRYDRQCQAYCSARTGCKRT